MTTLLEVSSVTKVYGEGGSNPDVALQDFSLTLPEKPAPDRLDRWGKRQREIDLGRPRPRIRHADLRRDSLPRP